MLLSHTLKHNCYTFNVIICLFELFVQIYSCELEKVEDFNGLTDFANTYSLLRGKSNQDDEDGNIAGEFKVIKFNTESKMFRNSCLCVFMFG